MAKALDRICAEAEAAIDDGYSLVVLSDRAIGRDRVPLSSLLATGAVHHHLVRKTKRTRIGIVVEIGRSPRSASPLPARRLRRRCDQSVPGVRGALACPPRRAAAAAGRLGSKPTKAAKARNTRRSKPAPTAKMYDPVTKEDHDLVDAYRKGVAKGMLKVMAKMGISTLQSYKGAQIFEAVGLRDEVIDRCFAGTASRIQGVDFDVLAEEALRRHALGYPEQAGRSAARAAEPRRVPLAGRRRAAHVGPAGDRRPASRRPQQQRRRLPPLRRAREPRRPHALRSSAACCKFKPGANGGPIPIDEVQPAKDIVKRFCTGAMSFGSISAEAHETLAIAMNRLGGKSNTGEGGEDPERFKPLPNGDSKRSAIKQVASGRFGVTI